MPNIHKHMAIRVQYLACYKWTQHREKIVNTKAMEIIRRSNSIGDSINAVQSNGEEVADPISIK